MATISLKKPQSSDELAIVPSEPSTAIVSATIGVPSAFEGEFTAADRKVPYLAICQKSGKMMDDNPTWLGNFVYDKLHCLGNKLNVVFFKCKKSYVEDLPYGSDAFPQKFNTIAESREAGVAVQEVGELDCLIEVPLDFEGAEEIDGKGYVPARYTVRSTAYGATVRILVKDVSLRLKGVLASGGYTLAIEKKTNGSNSWYAPKLSPNGMTPEAVLNHITDNYC
jgi:hypothetical protein